jgi:hypothetical protein
MNKLDNHSEQIAAALDKMRRNIVPGLSMGYIAEHFDEQERKLALCREALIRSLPAVEAESERFDSCCPDETLTQLRETLEATKP